MASEPFSANDRCVAVRKDAWSARSEMSKSYADASLHRTKHASSYVALSHDLDCFPPPLSAGEVRKHSHSHVLQPMFQQSIFNGKIWHDAYDTWRPIRTWQSRIETRIKYCIALEASLFLAWHRYVFKEIRPWPSHIDIILSLLMQVSGKT